MYRGTKYKFKKIQKVIFLTFTVLLLVGNELKSQNIDSIVKIIEKYTDHNNFDSVAYYIDFAKKQLKGKENQTDYAKILKEEGSLQLNLSNYPEAAKFFSKAMIIAENNSEKELIAGLKSELAVLYFEINDTVKAKKNISEAYKIMKEENFYDIYIAFNYGAIMYTQTDGKKALDFFLKEQKNVPDTSYKLKSNINNFIAHSFKKEKKYKNALKHFKIALKYSIKAEDTVLTSMNLTSAAYCYIKLEKLDSAYIFLQKSLKLAKKIDNKFAIKDALSILSVIYYKRNDIKNYKKTISELEDIKKYFFGLRVKTEIAKTEYKNKIRLLEKENLLKKTQIRYQLYIFISVSIILLLILFVLIKRYRYRKVINEQKIKILSEEEKNAKILNDILQNDIKNRAKELISKTIMISANEEMQKNILKNLEDIKTDDELAQLKISNIIKDIKINSKNIWDDFFMYFNDIHKDFLSYLDKNFPELTPTEKKIVTLIKLNLTTKEISQITYTSRRTIEKHRQNIRKKMSLDNNINLQEYIIKMKTSS